MAHDETGLGRAEDKVLKNRLVIDKTPGPEDLEPHVWSGDQGLTVTEYAPFGVIGAITPTTNPTATIINNTIAIVSAGNAVVFNAHPNAKRVSVQTIRWLNQAIVSAGGPPDLVTATPEPTIESAQRLMNHPQVRILMVTGGPGVVKEAQKTRKRSICAGPGNPPVVVDENADIELAGREIVRGASFDNNVICTDEKVVFVVESVADEPAQADGEEQRLPPQGVRAQKARTGDLCGDGRAREDRAASTRGGSARTPGASSPRSVSRPGTISAWCSPTFRPSTAWCGPSR